MLLGGAVVRRGVDDRDAGIEHRAEEVIYRAWVELRAAKFHRTVAELGDGHSGVAKGRRGKGHCAAWEAPKFRPKRDMSKTFSSP